MTHEKYIYHITIKYQMNNKDNSNNNRGLEDIKFIEWNK